MRRVVFIIALLFLPRIALSQRCRSDWCGWTAYWENDSFVHFLAGSDELYTNGIRFALGRNPLRNWRWVDSLGVWWQLHAPTARRKQEFVRTSAVVLGQNFFTPREITTYDADPTDRPYAGLLYTSVRLDFTEDSPRKTRHFPDLTFQHSLEGTVGIFGQTAFAGETQSAVHVLRKNRIPKGWDNQVRNSPAASATYMWRAKTNWPVLNFIPHAGLMLGLPQTYAYGGGTVSLGYHVTGFPSLLIQQTATPNAAAEDHAVELGLFAGVEGRAFAKNDVVEGRFGQMNPGLPARHGVWDRRYGFTFRFTDWRLSYTFLIQRSPEVVDSTDLSHLRHNYGAIAFSYEPGHHRTAGSRTGATEFFRNKVLGPAFRDFFLDATLGSGHVNRAEAATSDGPAMRVALGRANIARSGFFKYLGAGWEMGGLVRQGDRPSSNLADHSDRFLTSNTFFARVNPFPNHRMLESFHVRAGVGPGSSKRQLTPGMPGDRTATCPSGFTPDTVGRRTCNSIEDGRTLLLGASYGIPLLKGNEAVFLSDLSWRQLSLGGKTGVVMWTFGIGWRPGHVRPARRAPRPPTVTSGG
jgi:lipid A 3-O-deacylase